MGRASIRASRWWRRAGCAFVVAFAIASEAAIPVYANSYPGYSTSHYMETVSGSTLYGQGCSVGQAASSGSLPANEMIVLDFGQPWYSGGSYGANYWYGTTGAFASTSQIANAVEQFGEGFWNCSTSTPQLTVAAGVNSDSSYVGSAHGSAWGNMVASINSWFSTHSYSSQVEAEGAIDAESGFYASASAARSWASGYGTGSLFQNFGSANSCPTGSYGTSVPGYTCTSTPKWTQDDYWYLSWGASAAEPLPEIYNSLITTLPNGTQSDPNAQQWEMIRLYGNAAHTSAIYPSGSFTQHQACGSGCSGTNNSPLTGWTHLHDSLSYYSPTDTTLNFATDVKWGF